MNKIERIEKFEKIANDLASDIGHFNDLIDFKSSVRLVKFDCRQGVTFFCQYQTSLLKQIHDIGLEKSSNINNQNILSFLENVKVMELCTVVTKEIVSLISENVNNGDVGIFIGIAKKEIINQLTKQECSANFIDLVKKHFVMQK